MNTKKLKIVIFYFLKTFYQLLKTVMNKMWLQENENYYLFSLSSTCNHLYPQIYRICKKEHKICLRKISDNFTSLGKVQIEEDFVKKVCDKWENKNDSFGVLLSGGQGLGKTFVGKNICEKLNLPVILISSYYTGIQEFLTEITEDVIIFVDEYEKVFKNRTEELLSLMDGVLTNGKKMFILTTNNVNELCNQLLNRPGRIRYHKKFMSLSKNKIEKIINSNTQYIKLLENEKWKSDFFLLCDQMELVSIDNVIELLEEILMFQRSPLELVNDMNIDFIKDKKFNIVDFFNDYIYFKDVNVFPHPQKIKHISINSRIDFFVDGLKIGQIIPVGYKNNNFKIFLSENEDEYLNVLII